MLEEIRNIKQEMINKVGNIIAQKEAQIEQEVLNQIAINERDVVAPKFAEMDNTLYAYINEATLLKNKEIERIQNEHNLKVSEYTSMINAKKNELKELEANNVKSRVKSKYSLEINELSCFQQELQNS